MGWGLVRETGYEVRFEQRPEGRRELAMLVSGGRVFQRKELD